jgi:pimeloyl-ACP methyl ester carboxylesterase
MPYISAGSGKLHYQTIGNGKKIIVAFHGYGEQASVYNVFGPYLGQQYTILSFDLPFHGNSAWSTDHLTHDCLKVLIEEVTVRYSVDKVTLVGYSIGARVCLAAMYASPLRVDTMLLMAADGLILNRFYQFATRTFMGRWLFRTLLRGDIIVLLLHWCHKLHIVPNALYRMAIHSVGTAARRTQLLQAWPCLQTLAHKPAHLRHTIQQNGIRVYLYMGAKDKILPPALAYKFANGLPTIQLHILDRGHRIFDSDNAAQIAAPLLHI